MEDFAQKVTGGGGTAEPARHTRPLPRFRRLLPRQYVLGLWIFLRENRPRRDELRSDGSLPLPLLRDRPPSLPPHASPRLQPSRVAHPPRRLHPRSSAPVPLPVPRPRAH